MTWQFCALTILSNSISNSLQTARKSWSSLAGALDRGDTSSLASEARVIVVLGVGALGGSAREIAREARGVSYGFQQEIGKARGGGFAGGG